MSKNTCPCCAHTYMCLMIWVVQWSWQLDCSTHAARSMMHTCGNSSAASQCSISTPQLAHLLNLLKSYALELNDRFTVEESVSAAT